MADLDFIKNIKDTASELFNELGLVPTMVGTTQSYEINGCYIKFSYVAGLRCFVIEYAENSNNAKKNIYEDTDLFSVELGCEGILVELRKVFIEHYSNKINGI